MYFNATRSLTQADMGKLSDYGCWCYFEGHHGKGKGQPVDEIDEFCKTLHDGYECIRMDAEDAGMDCTPWDIDYNSAFGGGVPGGLTIDGIVKECNIQNTEGTCAAMTCKVEGWFVQQYVLYASHGGTIAKKFRHAKGFDPSEECGVHTGPGSPHEKASCAEYPLRFPYRVRNGNTGCCFTKTYNTALLDCCDDGSTQISC